MAAAAAQTTVQQEPHTEQGTVTGMCYVAGNAQRGHRSIVHATERIVLRLVPRKPRKVRTICPSHISAHRGLQKITWSEDTVDNEHANKRSSKSMCHCCTVEALPCTACPHRVLYIPPQTRIWRVER